MPSFRSSAALAAVALLFGQANAHGTVTGVVAEGKYYVGQSHWSTDPSAGWKANNGDNGFTRSLIDDSIICHNDAVPGTQYIKIAAGNSMELQWSVWPDSHKGPMLDYLAPCGDDCTTVNPTSLKFNKIDEAGLISGGNPGTWASDQMIANNNTWVTKIPASIAPGKYVLRHETIALHSAGESGGAQAYPQCLNIEVTGSGTNSLADGTPGTSLYKTTDPGILINIYQTLPSYVIPGPAVMAGGLTGASSSGAGSSIGSTKTATNPVTSTSKSAAMSVSSSEASVVVTASPTTLKNADSSKTSAPVVTASADGHKFICYEEL